MTTLDSKPIIDESSVPFFPTALKIGLYGGLILVIYNLIANMTGLSIPSSITNSVLASIVQIALYVGIGIFVVKKHREDELGGHISFGRAFLVSLIAMVVAGIISILFNILYMTVIDPTFVESMIDGMEEMFANLGMDTDVAEEQLESVRDSFSPMSQITTGLLGGSLAGAILSLIIAAVMKKNPPTI
ncbi:MAG TPA: DUF4199 domain-containing protein [Bacteroidetes bacterium]|nr:DUF4199 domain-containing protein [Bacteroidota bacterium]